MKAADPPEQDAAGTRKTDPEPDRAQDSLSEPLPSAEEIAHSLSQLLSGLPELAMRAAVLKERLEAVPARHAAQMLHILVKKGVEGGPPYNNALLALTEVLSGDALPYELLAGIYREAKDAGLETLAHALFGAGSVEPPVAEAAPVDPVGRSLTLGERKWLARKPDRNLLERLALDGDPRVIRNLLRNPRLVEQDVLKIATRRPANPAVLREVARSTRWISRYRVKRALVLNPYTPAELGLRLVPFLNRQDLRLVADSGNLADTLVAAATRLMKRA